MTKGPWDIKLFRQDHTYYYRIESQAKANGPKGKTTAHKNRALITAAPDLLECCESVLKWAKDNGSNELLVNELKDAIKKAKGK